MKHIHFIGICGVGMGALAVLWHKKGWKVTGSDAGFYPPISTHLTKHNINYYAGWHPEKIGALPPSLNLPLGQGETARPDLVVVGNVAGSQNPELKSDFSHFYKARRTKAPPTRRRQYEALYRTTEK